MPKDWKDIQDDEILNFNESDTKIVARYERIMQKKSIEAIKELRDKVAGLIDTIAEASKGLQEKTDKLMSLYSRISHAQRCQQIVLIILSIVVACSTAGYTWITWQSVKAMREANKIQCELLHLEKSKIGAQNAPHNALKPTP